MEEKFSVSLELMIQKFKDNAKRAQEVAKNVGNKIKENMSVPVGGSGFKSVSAEAELLLNKINDIKATLEMAKTDTNLLPKQDILEMRIELEKLEKQYSKLNQSSGIFSNSFKKVQDGMNKSLKSAKRFTLSLFGIQSGIRVVSRAMSAYSSIDEESSNKSQAAWIGLGSMFAWLKDMIADFAIKSVSYINVFVKALTGVDFLAKAMAKSMNKASKSATKLSKVLAGFDELTNLDDSAGGASVDTSWIDAFKNVQLDPSITNFFQKLGEAMKPVYEGVMKVVDWFKELDTTSQILIVTLGIGGLIGILTGKGGLVLGLGAVGLGVNGLTKIFDEDLTKSTEGLMSLLGAAGLVGILVGESKGISVAGAIAGVSLAFFGLNEYINGDTKQAIEGLILLLGGAGLAGAFIGGAKGLSVGLAIASVISIIQGFNDLLSGDTTKNIKGFISLVTGSAGLVFALGLLKGGLAGVNIPLLISVAGFAALAGGILLVTQNWGKMNTLEKVVSILGLIAVGAAAAAAAVGALQSAWSLGIAAAAIVAGTAAIAAAISNANKRAKENIPKLSVGTPYVEKSGYAMIHEGEAVVPKKFNSDEYFNRLGTNNSEQTNKLLEELIDRVERIEINPYTTIVDVGNASQKYRNQQSRIMGEELI
jgi:hypothetical protein